MEIHIITAKSSKIAEIISENVVISKLQDAIDILGNCYYQEATGIIIRKEQITEEFFDLQSRFAGDVLQKFSNYDMKLAIVGDFSQFKSKSLNDFIYESNNLGHINYVKTKEEAIAKFSLI